MQDLLSRHRNRALGKRTFERRISKCFARSLSKCIDMLDDISVSEMATQEKSACHLDLAFERSIGCHWRKFARAQAARCLPQVCREHFVAEQPPPRHSRIARFYEDLIAQNTERLEIFEIIRKLFLRDLFINFEGMLFRNAFDKDIDERKRAVLKYLMAYRVFKIDRYAETFDFLIHLCTDPPLDCGLTVHMLTTLCDSDVKRTCIVVSVRNMTCLENLLRHAADMRFDFWGLWTGIGYLSSEYNYIPCFMSTGINSEHSRMLLKYGFPYLAAPGVYVRRCRTLEAITFQDHSIVNPLGAVYLRMKADRGRMMLVMDTFTTFVDFQRSGDISDKVKTLVYLTRSLPDPLVTPAEVYHSLKEVVEPDFVGELKKISRMYAASKALDDDYGQSRPRRLLHLCRCSVRKMLADNFRLLNGIKELVIPEDLRTYLALDC